MTQRKLIIGSLALTLAIGSLLFVATGHPLGADAQSRGKSSPSPTTSASVSPSASPSESPSPSPTPAGSPSPVGDELWLWQQSWTKVVSSTDPVVIKRGAKVSMSTNLQPIEKAKAEGAGGPAGATSKNGSTASKVVSTGSSFFANPATLIAGTIAGTAIGYLVDSLLGGGDDSAILTQCYSARNKTRPAIWSSYIAAKGVSITGPKKGAITGRVNANIDESYVISNVFTTDEADSTEWKMFRLLIHRPKAINTIKVYYRISDDGGTTDPNDDSWIQLEDPTIKASVCAKNFSAASYKLNKVGKYIQYKINLTGGKNKNNLQAISKVAIQAQPVKLVGGNDKNPSPSPSASPSIDPNKAGKLTIITKKLTSTTASNPSPAGPPLPNLTPTPKASASAAPTKPNPLCFDNDKTEPAPGVNLKVKQTEGGDVFLEDQVTNDNGKWQGVDSGVDDFPVGTYVVNFGDFAKEDYKLVAICVEPNDGAHILKTQTDPLTGKATILIKAKTETKVIALYGPRNKPFISVNKFAIDSANKVMKIVYPGQSFRYLIRYTNTSDTEARDVTIQDVIPEQFFVASSDTVDPTNPTDFDTSLDALGRTIISKKISSLKPAEKKQIVVPVTLKPDAFGSPDDIAGTITSNNQADQAATQSNSGSGLPGTDTGDLQLQ